MDKSRLQFYSDGVFVIAATILVLNFTVPVLKTGLNVELAAKLLSLWPQFLIYILSFGVIGNIWRVHNAVLNPAMVIDHTTVMINMALLAFTAFIPFATAVAGTYPTLPAAAVLYSMAILLVIVTGYTMAAHLAKIKSYGEQMPASVAAAMRSVRVAAAIRLVGLIAAAFAPLLSYALYWLVLIFYAFSAELDGRAG